MKSTPIRDLLISRRSGTSSRSASVSLQREISGVKRSHNWRFHMKVSSLGPPVLAAVLILLVSVPTFAHHGASSYDTT